MHHLTKALERFLSLVLTVNILGPSVDTQGLEYLPWLRNLLDLNRDTFVIVCCY